MGSVVHWWNHLLLSRAEMAAVPRARVVGQQFWCIVIPLSVLLSA